MELKEFDIICLGIIALRTAYAWFIGYKKIKFDEKGRIIDN